MLPAPPNPVEPLVDATNNAPPFMGWFSFESDYPTIQYEPAWAERFSESASQGEYHRTDTAYGTATFAFEGEGLRIRYVAATNMGIFQIVVDGVVIDTIDAYAETLTFPGTKVYSVGSGSHLLEIQATGRKNDRSDGSVVGLDAIQVYRGDANTADSSAARDHEYPDIHSPGRSAYRTDQRATHGATDQHADLAACGDRISRHRLRRERQPGRRSGRGCSGNLSPRGRNDD